jgi:hypothetical protein
MNQNDPKQFQRPVLWRRHLPPQYPSFPITRDRLRALVRALHCRAKIGAVSGTALFRYCWLFHNLVAGRMNRPTV